MRKLLILGSSLGSVDIVRKAHAMGCHVIVTDYVPVELSQAKREADEYWAVSTADLDELEVRCHREGVNAVYSGVSEFNLDRVLDLCERLGLPCYFDRRAWGYARDKSRFKEQCRAVGVPVTPEITVDEAMAEGICAGVPAQDIPFPVVVKPVDGCGNAGVSFCHDTEDLAEAWELVRRVSSNPRVLVERYIRGEEYHYAYALADGEASLLSSLMSFVQPGYPNNLYSLGTTICTHVEEWVRDVSPAVVRLLKRCGCRDGVAFVQAIRKDGQYYVLEMGYRLGADMTFNKIMGMTGFDAVRWMLELQLGMRHTRDQLPRPQTHAFRECASMYGLFAAEGGTVSRIEGEDAVRELSASRCDGTAVDQINEITWEPLVHPGDEVRQYQLMGKLTFHTQDAKELCDILRHVNQRLKIVDASGHNMFVRFTDYDTVLATYERTLAEGQ